MKKIKELKKGDTLYKFDWNLYRSDKYISPIKTIVINNVVKLNDFTKFETDFSDDVDDNRVIINDGDLERNFSLFGYSSLSERGEFATTNYAIAHKKWNSVKDLYFKN